MARPSNPFAGYGDSFVGSRCAEKPRLLDPSCNDPFQEAIRTQRRFYFDCIEAKATGIIERILRRINCVKTRKQEFWSGARDEAPILLGVIPFGLLFGALAISAHLSSLAAQAMSAIIFAGSAQFIAAQLVGTATSGVVILMVVCVINLRHALYSASVAPHVKNLNKGWKLLLAYLLTDEAYAVTITHYAREGDSETRHWYFLGAGLTLWSAWQISTAAGIFIGAQIPPSWPLGFVLPLTFIALVVPSLKDRAGVAAALVAGAVGLLAFGLPYKTGLLVAALIGILTGLLVERRLK
jgi:4-azaleucine resistance transporter AzlC